MKELAARLLCTAAAPVAGAPAETSQWLARVGVLNALYRFGATITTNGQALPRATAHVGDNVSVTFDAGHEVRNRSSVMVMHGSPSRPTISGEHTVAFLGELGKVRYGPARLTDFHHPPAWRASRLYAGLCAAYAIILNDHDTSVSRYSVHNNWGLVLQPGAVHELKWQCELPFDVTQRRLSIDAHGFLEDGVPVTANVALDPTLASPSVRFRFN